MTKRQISINRFKVKDNLPKLNSDLIAVEEPLQITLKQGALSKVFSITLRTPGDDKELITGLLFSEQIIDRAEDIDSFSNEQVDNKYQANLITVNLSSQLHFNPEEITRNHPSYSGCGFCGKTSLKTLELKPIRKPRAISALLGNPLVKSIRKLLASQGLFSQTGGSHVAGLIYENKGKLDFGRSVFFEDVGRHNALDKLIGHQLINNDLGQPGILVLSGRIGFELVQKTIVSGYSTIIALGAPSSLAIQAAKQFDIVLIGFAKDDSFNLYTADISLVQNPYVPNEK